MSQAPSSLSFDQSEFAGPLERLTGLPNLAYVSEEFAAFERDEVLAKTWVCIANTAELAAEAWLQPVDWLGLPLLVVRDRESEIRVFHNVCSHRGMKLVADPGQVKGVITCRYHGWCYGADGALRATPHIKGEGEHEDERFDRALHGLKAVRSQLFAGLVFVNLSGDAPPFEQFIEPVLTLWSNFDFDHYGHGGAGSSWQLDLACNWKLAQENHVDGYHLPFVHPGLNSYSPLRNHYPLLLPGRASGQGSGAQNHAAEIGSERLPLHPSLGEDWYQGRAEFLSIFPNVMMGVHADHIWFVYLVPLAVDRTRERMDLYYVGDGATAREFEPQRRQNCERMLEIFKEDRDIVEGLQHGRCSPGFEGGAFSPELDRPAHLFNRWMAEEVVAGLARRDNTRPWV